MTTARLSISAYGNIPYLGVGERGGGGGGGKTTRSPLIPAILAPNRRRIIGGQKSSILQPPFGCRLRGDSVISHKFLRF